MYQPSDKILSKYADVMVNYALWDGKGINKGDIVRIGISESAKPLLGHLQKAILKSGGKYLISYYPEGLSRIKYEIGNSEQIEYFPTKVMQAYVEECDHFLFISSESDPNELKGIPGEKLMAASKNLKPYMDLRNKKQSEGKFSWTVASYGTKAMADEAGLSIEEYWQQIIEACYLDKGNPVGEWRKIQEMINTYKAKLDLLEIQSLQISADDIDMEIKLGSSRRWLGGTGSNIPSFEIFTSPDWRGTNGWIKFNQPLYRYGNKISGIEIHFEDGIVTSAIAKENQDLLINMIETEGANKLGEFSLTDRRFSRITKFMADTLYDENVGGEFGNTHVAFGKSFQEAYRGDRSSVKDRDWDKMGFNDSVIHTDVMSTSNRVVTAKVKDGTELIIYKNGEFQLD
jgi:aminopeptidase